jgi:hypothetical protein
VTGARRHLGGEEGAGRLLGFWRDDGWRRCGAWWVGGLVVSRLAKAGHFRAFVGLMFLWACSLFIQ